MPGLNGIRRTSALYRPRPLVRVFVVMFAIALAAGVGANLHAMMPPSLRFAIALLGVSLAFALVAVPAGLPWRIAVGGGTVSVSYPLWRRTIATSAVVRIRVLAEGALDRLFYGRGNAHTVIIEYRSLRGAPKRTSLTVDASIYAALRAALSEREWVQEA